jgi:ubiquinone/menaquinone biosynthesis C-methylase UbiE
MKRSPYQDPAVAATFDRVSEPAQFAQPARDLVAMMAIPAGSIVLDVGTGTGAFARPASEAVGPSGFVVGLDPSLAMLRAAHNRAPFRLIIGQAPGLPFRDGTFDAAAASFVVHHCHSYSAALADMNRVCRSGGRVGITEWGTTPNLPGQVWKDLVASYVDVNRVEAAFRDLVPWEEWFGTPANVERALAGAGFTAIEVTTREYTVVVTPGDYVRMKGGGVEGTLIRQMLDETRWNDFRSRANELFLQQFGDSVTFVRDVHFGVARKRGNINGGAPTRF